MDKNKIYEVLGKMYSNPKTVEKMRVVGNMIDDIIDIHLDLDRKTLRAKLTELVEKTLNVSLELIIEMEELNND